MTRTGLQRLRMRTIFSADFFCTGSVFHVTSTSGASGSFILVPEATGLRISSGDRDFFGTTSAFHGTSSSGASGSAMSSVERNFFRTNSAFHGASGASAILILTSETIDLEISSVIEDLFCTTSAIQGMYASGASGVMVIPEKTGLTISSAANDFFSSAFHGTSGPQSRECTLP